jgi:mono/diheme cytochrome c family protein
LARRAFAEYVLARMARKGSALAVLFLFSVTASVTPLMGCDRPPSPSEAKEWTPQDHDRIEENARTAQGQAPGGSAAPPPASLAGMPSGPQAEQLIDKLWAQVCADCHGASGRADGPRSSEAKPPDMSDPAWQTKMTDADITAAIRNGKGKMPKFERLPEPFVAGLIKRIRTFRKQ